MYLAKYARSAEYFNQLGILSPYKNMYHICIYCVLYCFFVIIVQEFKYEKVYPTLDGIDYKTSKQFSFTITPSTEYFTRYFFYL